MTPTLLSRTQIDADATRRRFLQMIGAAGLLAGCADPAAEPSPSPTAGFPRTIEHSGGRTELSRPPERIFLANHIGILDEMLALGILPAVYATTGDPLTSWQQKVPGIADVPTTPYEIDLELLARERIDCAILDYAGYDDFGPRIRQLAPAIRMPEPFTRPAMMAMLGPILGREQDVAALDAARTAKLKAWQPPRRPASVTVFFTYDPAKVYIYGGPSELGVFLAEAGLATKDRGRPADEEGSDLSVENIGQLDDDAILAVAPYAEYAPALDALQNNTLFQRIPAVRDGRYTRLTHEESTALLSGSSLALDTALAALDRALAD